VKLAAPGATLAAGTRQRPTERQGQQERAAQTGTSRKAGSGGKGPPRHARGNPSGRQRALQHGNTTRRRTRWGLVSRRHRGGSSGRAGTCVHPSARSLPRSAGGHHGVRARNQRGHTSPTQPRVQQRLESHRHSTARSTCTCSPSKLTPAGREPLPPQKRAGRISGVCPEQEGLSDPPWIQERKVKAPLPFRRASRTTAQSRRFGAGKNTYAAKLDRIL
jgi:hypothetical protein